MHLLSHEDGQGGQTVLVDGFKAARDLRDTNQDAYGALRDVRLFHHASGNEGLSIGPSLSSPTLLHDQDTGDLIQVRWNNADRASMPASLDEINGWYTAAT